MAEPNLNLTRQIRRELKALRDPERAAGQQNYMKRALPFLGVRVPQARKVSYDACKANPLDRAEEYRATLKHAFYSAKFQEERYAAAGIASFKGHSKFQTSGMFPLYKQLIKDAAWWDVVDELSGRVGEILLKQPDKARPVLLKWSVDDDIWLRRSAIICQVRAKHETDTELLEAVIEPSIDRPEFFLRKGIGWALRDLSWYEPAFVADYIKRHKSELSPLSLKEASRQLLKSGYLKSR